MGGNEEAGLVVTVDPWLRNGDHDDVFTSTFHGMVVVDLAGPGGPGWPA